MAHLVLRADLARMLGISRAAVTKRCDKSWAEACVGDRVDTDHPAIQEAGAARGAKLPKPARAPTKAAKAVASPPEEPTATVKKFKSRGPKPTRDLPVEDEPLLEHPENSGSLEDLTDLSHGLQPYLDRFGTGRSARDWVIFQKDTETTIGRKLANAQARAEVIPREFVRSNVIGLIDGVNSRLLSDTPKTLCRQLYSLARSGAPVEDAEKMIRQLLGKQLSGLKARVEKALLHGIDSGNGGRSNLARGADRIAHDRADSDDALGVG